MQQQHKSLQGTFVEMAQALPAEPLLAAVGCCWFQVSSADWMVRLQMSPRGGNWDKAAAASAQSLSDAHARIMAVAFRPRCAAGICNFSEMSVAKSRHCCPSGKTPAQGGATLIQTEKNIRGEPSCQQFYEFTTWRAVLQSAKRTAWQILYSIEQACCSMNQLCRH